MNSKHSSSIQVVCGERAFSAEREWLREQATVSVGLEAVGKYLLVKNADDDAPLLLVTDREVQ